VNRVFRNFPRNSSLHWQLVVHKGNQPHSRTFSFSIRRRYVNMLHVQSLFRNAILQPFHYERSTWRSVIQLNVVQSIRHILDNIPEDQRRRSPGTTDSPSPSPEPPGFSLSQELLTLKMRLCISFSLSFGVYQVTCSCSPSYSGRRVSNPETDHPWHKWRWISSSGIAYKSSSTSEGSLCELFGLEERYQ
jgi:hypothetical protein